MKFFRHLALTALALSLALPAAAGTSTFATFADAQKAAKDAGKPLLVDFFTDWCGPCKAFDKARADDAAIQAAVGQFVFHQTDAEKGEGIELAKRFQVTGYPTYVVFNAEGQVAERWMGYEKDFFVERADAAIADPLSIEAKAERFAANPTEQDAELLARVSASMGDNTSALKYYATAQDLTTDADYSDEVFQTTFYAFRSGDATAADLTAAADKMFASDAMQPIDLLVGARMLAGVMAETPEAAVPYIKTAVEASEGNTEPGVPQYRAALMPEYALFVEKNAAKAVEYKRTSLGEGWETNPDKLNSFAWWCFENNINLEEAQDLAMKAVDLAEPGADRANILDTLAEICNARGNCGEALTYIEQAIAENPGREYFAKQKVKFEAAQAAQGDR